MESQKDTQTCAESAGCEVESEIPGKDPPWDRDQNPHDGQGEEGTEDDGNLPGPSEVQPPVLEFAAYLQIPLRSTRYMLVRR
jgi:hypothetical protein